MRRIAACVFVFVSLYVVCGCDRTKDRHENQPRKKDAGQPSSRARTPPSDLVSSLRSAKTDDERWAIVRKDVEWYSYDPIPAFDTRGRPEAFIVDQMGTSSEVAMIWYEYFPDLPKYLELSPRDLYGVGGCFGIMYRGSTRRDGPQIWLKRLTGTEFKSRDGFKAWFAANKERLVWDKPSGMFKLVGPASQSQPNVNGR
ncbi:MAG: hypothetical protein NT031_16840 [Planctomycetota bacterium]|nr:hypothetical protein [Planctomycetota bacterium]